MAKLHGHRVRIFWLILLASICLAVVYGCDNDDDDDTDDDQIDDDDINDDDDDDDDDDDRDAWSVSSPDGTITAEIQRLNLAGTADYPAGENLYYRVLHGGIEVLNWSPLGISIESSEYLSGLEFIGESSRLIDETYEMFTGKSSVRVNLADELTLQYRNPDGNELHIIFRAYDDGIAFRYTLPGEGKTTVTGEYSGFRIPAGAIGWMQSHDPPTFSTPAYEQHYQKVVAGEYSEKDGWGFPVLFQLAESAVFVMITEAGLDRGYCGTRLHQEVPCNVYRVRFPSDGEGLGYGWTDPVGVLPITTPWRAIIIGGLDAVTESVMVDSLSPARDPVFDGNTDWIKPGRSAWSWWSQETGDLALQMQYVDSAAEFGWEYILVDARWDKWPDIDTVMPGLVQYAESKDVGILLWYNSGGPHNLMLTETPRDRMLDPEVRRAEFQKLADWGVRGVKVDFFHSDKQDRIMQFLDILSDAAEFGILVNFHGCTIPRGWQRTYPNLMTMEAVRGAETYKPLFVDPPTAGHNVWLVFTRNVVGPMDYTPVTFSQALDRCQLTYAHQLALSVVFESGLQHFADQADSDPNRGFHKVFNDYPYVGDFMRIVPSTWDQTEFLDGHPDSHVVLARRKGDDWYLGALNAQDSQIDISVPLTFLDSGSYEMLFIGSGEQPDEFRTESAVVTSSDLLNRQMKPRDGFVVHLSARKKEGSGR